MTTGKKAVVVLSVLAALAIADTCPSPQAAIRSEATRSRKVPVPAVYAHVGAELTSPSGTSDPPRTY